MKVTGLKWGGTRTERFDETVDFFEQVMGLQTKDRQPGFCSFEMESGDVFEIFGPDEDEHRFMTTGPVIGFGVDDVDAARSHLEERGVSFIGETQSEGDYRWAHFRGPDGNVYEISSS